MIIGYNIKCKGLNSPMSVRGDMISDCVEKFKQYWEHDYDVDTDAIEEIKVITVDFDIM